MYGENVQWLLFHTFHNYLIDLIKNNFLKKIPQPKAETRWEKFAKIKGIKHKKKSKWDWDEAYVHGSREYIYFNHNLSIHRKQEWRPRTGYQKANDPMGDWVREDRQSVSASGNGLHK